MATYPNNYRTGVGFLQNYTFFGVQTLYSYNAEYGTGAGSRLNRHISEHGNWSRFASAPNGYGMDTPFPPVRAGGISAYNQSVAQLDMNGSLIQGGPMQGTGAVLTLAQEGALSLTIGLEGATTVATLSGENILLRLTISLGGEATLTFTGSSGLSMVVPFDGSGVVAALVGTSNLKGRLGLEGEWTPFTELSPQNLAAAVWEYATRTLTSGGGGGGLDAAGVRAAIGMAAANLDAQLAALPASVRAELATELARIDAAISSRANGGDVAAIKVKTDQLGFTVPGQVDSNIQYVNDVAVEGTGATGDEWGPAQ